MPRKPNPDPKTLALRQQGCLNPHPELVTDELFQAREFFDPRDLVQVKYEMLRRVETEGLPVSRSAAAFGFSRPSFYQAQETFQQGGLPALMPQKRGPKQAHKLTAEVLAFLRQVRQEDPWLRPAALASRIQDRYGITVHPRSIAPAWMRASSWAVPPAPWSAGKSVQPWNAISSLPCDVRSQAAVILAGILLSHPRETTLCKATCTK